jgi:hypothetical protein
MQLAGRSEEVRDLGTSFLSQMGCRVSLQAVCHRGSQAMKAEKGGSPPSPDEALPPLAGSTWTYLCGLFLPLCLPLQFIAGWIIVLVKFA